MGLATDQETLLAVALALLAVPPTLEFWLAYVAAMVVGLGVVQVRGRRYTG